MKRAARLIVFTLVSSLLLTSCEGLPTNMDDLINWRANFVLNISTSQLQEYLGGIIVLIVILVMFKGLKSLIYDLGSGTSPLSLDGKIAGTLAIFLSVALVYCLIPGANLITNKILGSLTIDEVFNNLGISLQIAAANAWITGQAVGLTIVLPQMVAGALLCTLLASIFWITISVFTLTNKALWVMVSILLGHIFFLTFYRLIETIVGTINNAWAFGMGKVTALAFYIGLTILFWFVCYFVIPFCAMLFGPEVVGPRMKHHEEPSGDGFLKRAVNQAKKIDLDAVMPIFVSGNKSKSTEHYEAEVIDENPVTDGTWEPVAELKPGFPELPPSSNYVTSTEPEPPSPQQGGQGTGNSFTDPKSSSTPPPVSENDQKRPEGEVPPEFVGNDQPRVSSEKPQSEKIATTRKVVKGVVTVGAIVAGIAAKNPEVSMKVAQVGGAVDSVLSATERAAKEKEGQIPIEFAKGGQL